MNKFIFMLLGTTQALFARGRMTLPEPGRDRGCNWSSEHGAPAPDLVSDEINMVLNRTKYPIKVVKEEPSPYFTKNRIIKQDPPACSRWKTSSREVRVVISSGKTRVEAAFVKDKTNHFVPYFHEKFGAPKIQGSECVTSTKNLPIYDIGNPLVASLYHPTACSLEGTPKTKPQELRIIAEAKLLDKRKFEISFIFYERNTGNEVPAKELPLMEPYIVNPGFQREPSFAMQGFRHLPRTFFPATKPFILIAKQDIPSGEYWITFALRNLDTKDINESSEPMKIIIEP